MKGKYFAFFFSLLVLTSPLTMNRRANANETFQSTEFNGRPTLNTADTYSSSAVQHFDATPFYFVFWSFSAVVILVGSWIVYVSIFSRSKHDDWQDEIRRNKALGWRTSVRNAESHLGLALGVQSVAGITVENLDTSIDKLIALDPKLSAATAMSLRYFPALSQQLEDHIDGVLRQPNIFAYERINLTAPIGNYRAGDYIRPEHLLDELITEADRLAQVVHQTRQEKSSESCSES